MKAGNMLFEIPGKETMKEHQGSKRETKKTQVDSNDIQQKAGYTLTTQANNIEHIDFNEE